MSIEASFDDIKDEIETIGWYHTFLPTKLWRILYERECCQREKNKYLKELAKKDFKKFRLLVMKSINKSIKAWRNLAKKRKEFNGAAKKFSALLKNIKDEFKKETENLVEKKEKQRRIKNRSHLSKNLT